MKILVFGDIHGRTGYADVIDKEDPDKVIFLGDYVSSHDNISGEQQVEVVSDIIERKKVEPNKYILLRGNHDTQHLGYYWAESCAYNPIAGYWMLLHKEEFLENTQWVYIDEEQKLLFSHAGVSDVWLKEQEINDIHEINNIEPCEKFGFISNRFSDYYGESVTQPPVWIRPAALIQCYHKGYTQIVGHTPVAKTIFNLREVPVFAGKLENDIWLCDNFPQQYLVIEDGKFIVRDIQPV